MMGDVAVGQVALPPPVPSGGSGIRR
jgi:hypothetical protein